VIGIKDIETLFRKVDNSLTRIEAEHMFNDMAYGKITLTVD
jgi:signal recognition particle GTPase